MFWLAQPEPFRYNHIIPPSTSIFPQDFFELNNIFMKKFLQEFRDFALKGNVIDLAVAVVIGGAFGKIVSSLVADIITPLISLLSAGGSLAEWSITLREASETAAAVTLNAGLFLQNIVDFLIIAGSIFLVIKLANKVKEPFKKKEEAEVQKEKLAALTKDQELLVEIRDLLKKE